MLEKKRLHKQTQHNKTVALKLPTYEKTGDTTPWVSIAARSVRLFVPGTRTL